MFIYIIITPLLLSLTYCYFNFFKYRKPKNYKDEFLLDTNYSLEIGNTRNGFSKKKIPKNIDYIVIGSGIGGLTCAGLLSRCGYRVLVLEQHYIAGGCTHTFIDKGYEFDTGLHYIGNIGKRKKILDLITNKKIIWDKIGEEDNGLYDNIIINDKEYPFRAGEEKFKEMLYNKFPNEKENIDNYIKYAKKVAKSDDFFLYKIIKCKPLAKFLNYFVQKNFFSFVSQTAEEVVDKFTNNKELKSVLLSQYGGYGKLPNNASFYIHASYFVHYLNGAWYPREGPSIIAKNIIPVIERTGGRVLVRKGVKKIIIHNHVAKGVEMENGVKIMVKNGIISSAGVYNTWNKLIESIYLSKNLENNIEKCGQSSSMLYAFIGFNRDGKELNLKSNNYWIFPNGDFEKTDEEFMKQPLKKDFSMFIGFPCMKDRDWDNRYKDKSNAVIIISTGYDFFKKWEESSPNRRPEDYKLWKKKMLDVIIEKSLGKYFPDTIKHIDYKDLATPLTFNNFIGTVKGECYGLDNKLIRYKREDWLRPQTYIKDLYLTGQDITNIGITGAMMGGVLTAHTVLGYGSLLDLILGRNLIVDIMKMDKND